MGIARSLSAFPATRRRNASILAIAYVGCGPIRAGVHFISFLNEGNYYGVDNYNNSFIRKTASLLVAESGFSGKHPTLRVISNFDFSAFNQQFDFVNVFSGVFELLRRSTTKAFF